MSPVIAKPFSGPKVYLAYETCSEYSVSQPSLSDSRWSSTFISASTGRAKKNPITDKAIGHIRRFTSSFIILINDLFDVIALYPRRCDEYFLKRERKRLHEYGIPFA